MRYAKSIIAGLMLLAGCEAVPPEKPAPQAREERRLVVVTPARTAFKGEGKTVTRSVDSIRIASPFGVSPGEVVARQQPMSVTEGQAPGINISPGGVGTTAGGGGGAYASGGGKWGLWDVIWSALKRGMVWLSLPVIALVVLLVIPATRPIATIFVKWVGGLLTAGVSWLVELIKTRKAAATAEDRFAQVVSGGERFKAALAQSGLDTDAQAKVRAIFRAEQQAAQDRDTQAKIRETT